MMDIWGTLSRQDWVTNLLITSVPVLFTGVVSLYGWYKYRFRVASLKKGVLDLLPETLKKKWRDELEGHLFERTFYVGEVEYRKFGDILERKRSKIFQLIADGGSGKTVSLLRFFFEPPWKWGYSYKVIPVFLELKQAKLKGSNYIFGLIRDLGGNKTLEMKSLSPPGNTEDDYISKGVKKGHKFLFLLDGYNEIGNRWRSCRYCRKSRSWPNARGCIL